MERWVCIRECWFKNKLWKEGEYAEVNDPETDLPWGVDPEKKMKCIADPSLPNPEQEVRHFEHALSIKVNAPKQAGESGLPVDEKAVTMARLDALGIGYDKRWGINKLLMVLRQGEGINRTAVS